jgi:hypothetical protein
VTDSATEERVEAKPALDPELVYLPRLLLWLLEEAKGSTQVGDDFGPTGFAEREEIHVEIVGDLLRLLAERGLVKFNYQAEQLTVTEAGFAEAARMRADLTNRGVRYQFARTGIICWLLDAHDGGPADALGFLWSSESFIHGHALTRGEIEAAVTYLTERKLLTAAPSGEGHQLTADGQDCAIQGGNVNDFRSQPNTGGGDTYNFQSVQGAVIGGRKNTVNQSNNYGVNLSEIDQLVQLAATARQLHPTLALPDDEQAEVEASTQALALEAGSAAPDQSRLRSAADRFMVALKSATNVTSEAVSTASRYG